MMKLKLYILFLISPFFLIAQDSTSVEGELPAPLSKIEQLILDIESEIDIEKRFDFSRSNSKEKQLADLKIYCLVLQHDDMSKDFLKDKSYQEEMDFLVSNEIRNKYIRNLCLSLEGNSLCLFQYVEKHGTILKKLIEDKNENKKVFFVYGGVDTEERERIRAITEKSDNSIIIASYGTFSTGINIRNLHNIVFSSPSKSRIRNLQSIGRGLRLKDNNSNATLYDISDDLTYQGKENYTLSHFKERINIYNEEGFDYEVHQVELRNGNKDNKTS